MVRLHGVFLSFDWQRCLNSVPQERQLTQQLKYQLPQAVNALRKKCAQLRLGRIDCGRKGKALRAVDHPQTNLAAGLEFDVDNGWHLWCLVCDAIARRFATRFCITFSKNVLEITESVLSLLCECFCDLRGFRAVKCFRQLAEALLPRPK